MEGESSIQLLNRWREGDQEAATELFDKYVKRLCALARSRLSNRMQRRVEPEDIVQSAYRSFFRHAEDRYELEKPGDLWRLLAAITVSKVRGQVEFHSAQKRGIYLEQSVKSDGSVIHVSPEAVAEDPSPEEAAAVTEEVTNIIRELDDFGRTVFELSMQNQSIEQIAETVERSQRTIRRTLQNIRESLEKKLEERLA